MKKNRSLKFKLISYLGTASFLFVALLGTTSYFLYSKNVRSLSNQQIETSNQQSLVNYETYFNNAISVSTSIQSKFDNINVEDSSKEITDYFDDIMALKKEIKSISYFNEDNGNLIVHSTRYTPIDNPIEQDWFKDSVKNPLIDIFSRIELINNETYSFSLTKLVSNDKGNKSGVLKVDYNFDEMVSLINQTDLGYGGHITIYDKNYDVVFCSSNYNVKEGELVKDLVLGSEIVNLNGNDYKLFVSTISKTGWKVAIFTNYSSIVGTINMFLLLIISLGVLLFALFALFIVGISSTITRPIILLQLEMAKVASLNYNVSDLKSIHGSQEVEALSNSFSKMMYRIKELANKLLIEEENKRISELRALQNQINPHFLYNTLDSIVYLIDSDEKEKASQMIIALSKFFRISISKGRNVIPFSKEIEHVTNYLLIQKIRFGKQFEYSIDVDPRILDVPVIKLVLQPIVENAIIHGFNELEYVGRIDIKGTIVGDLIRFDIKDNGYGILPEKIQAIYDSFKNPEAQEGVGFKNVYQRLRLYYGEKADIKIESELDSGTDVIIFIPLNGGKKNG